MKPSALSQKEILAIGNKWFGIKFTVAYMNDYRFMRVLRRGTAHLVQVRRRRLTAEQLREIAAGMNELAEMLDGKKA